MNQPKNSNDLTQFIISLAGLLEEILCRLRTIWNIEKIDIPNTPIAGQKAGCEKSFPLDENLVCSPNWLAKNMDAKLNIPTNINSAEISRTF